METTNNNFQNEIEIQIKEGPKIKCFIKDTFEEFYDQLKYFDYNPPKGELSYIDNNNCKILIKSENDYITFLRYISSNSNNLKVFYERDLSSPVLSDEQFKNINNVYSGQNLEESIDLEKKPFEVKINNDNNNNENKNKIELKYSPINLNNINLNNLIPEKDNQLLKIIDQIEYIEKSRTNSIINSTLNINKSNISCIGNNKETTHYGMKCNKCNENPIKGYRYQCPKCLNYNLCSDCEEENSLNQFHPHLDFILVRKSYINNDENSYSYCCLAKNLKFNYDYETIKIQKEDILKLSPILIKNNFNLPWPGKKRTMFKCDRAMSTIFCEKIFLQPLNLNQCINIEVSFKKIKTVPKGSYKCYLNFCVDDQKYGKVLELKINLV